MIASTRIAVVLALLARLTAGAEVCGQVPDCVLDVGRACAKKHLELGVSIGGRVYARATAAKVVASRNAGDVDDNGCYTATWALENDVRFGKLSANVAFPVLDYLDCVAQSEVREKKKMSRHGQACDDVCANMCPAGWDETDECRALCSLKLACPARNEAYYYDLDADAAIIGPLRDLAVGDACRAAFARDELSEDDDEAARLLYAGEARETAKTLMEHQNSKSARRFKRLREELSSRTAGRDL